jgi:aspartyl-tRNA(Asn)/glutamyl-tRNA(Gln) amidotransferase subunit C
MKIGTDEAARIARLAHLALSADELEALAGEMSTILSYVDRLGEFDGQEPAAESSAAPLRDDLPSPSLDRSDVESNAPLWRDGFFIVPRVIGE